MEALSKIGEYFFDNDSVMTDDQQCVLADDRHHEAQSRKQRHRQRKSLETRSRRLKAISKRIQVTEEVYEVMSATGSRTHTSTSRSPLASEESSATFSDGRQSVIPGIVSADLSLRSVSTRSIITDTGSGVEQHVSDTDDGEDDDDDDDDYSSAEEYDEDDEEDHSFQSHSSGEDSDADDDETTAVSLQSEAPQRYKRSFGAFRHRNRSQRTDQTPKNFWTARFPSKLSSRYSSRRLPSHDSQEDSRNSQEEDKNTIDCGHTTDTDSKTMVNQLLAEACQSSGEASSYNVTATATATVAAKKTGSRLTKEVTGSFTSKTSVQPSNATEISMILSDSTGSPKSGKSNQSLVARNTTASARTGQSANNRWVEQNPTQQVSAAVTIDGSNHHEQVELLLSLSSLLVQDDDEQEEDNDGEDKAACNFTFSETSSNINNNIASPTDTIRSANLSATGLYPANSKQGVLKNTFQATTRNKPPLPTLPPSYNTSATSAKEPRKTGSVASIDGSIQSREKIQDPPSFVGQSAYGRTTTANKAVEYAISALEDKTILNDTTLVESLSSSHTNSRIRSVPTGKSYGLVPASPHLIEPKPANITATANALNSSFTEKQHELEQSDNDAIEMEYHTRASMVIDNPLRFKIEDSQNAIEMEFLPPRAANYYDMISNTNSSVANSSQQPMSSKKQDDISPKSAANDSTVDTKAQEQPLKAIPHVETKASYLTECVEVPYDHVPVPVPAVEAATFSLPVKQSSFVMRRNKNATIIDKSNKIKIAKATSKQSTMTALTMQDAGIEVDELSTQDAASLKRQEQKEFAAGQLLCAKDMGQCTDANPASSYSHKGTNVDDNNNKNTIIKAISKEFKVPASTVQDAGIEVEELSNQVTESPRRQKVKDFFAGLLPSRMKMDQSTVANPEGTSFCKATNIIDETNKMTIVKATSKETTVTALSLQDAGIEVDDLPSLEESSLKKLNQKELFAGQLLPSEHRDQSAVADPKGTSSYKAKPIIDKISKTTIDKDASKEPTVTETSLQNSGIEVDELSALKEASPRKLKQKGFFDGQLLPLKPSDQITVADPFSSTNNEDQEIQGVASRTINGEVESVEMGLEDAILQPQNNDQDEAVIVQPVTEHLDEAAIVRSSSQATIKGDKIQPQNNDQDEAVIVQPANEHLDEAAIVRSSSQATIKGDKIDDEKANNDAKKKSQEDVFNKGNFLLRLSSKLRRSFTTSNKSRSFSSVEDSREEPPDHRSQISQNDRVGQRSTGNASNTRSPVIATSITSIRERQRQLPPLSSAKSSKTFQTPTLHNFHHPSKELHHVVDNKVAVEKIALANPWRQAHPNYVEPAQDSTDFDNPWRQGHPNCTKPAHPSKAVTFREVIDVSNDAKKQSKSKKGLRRLKAGLKGMLRLSSKSPKIKATVEEARNVENCSREEVPTITPRDQIDNGFLMQMQQAHSPYSSSHGHQHHHSCDHHQEDHHHYASSRNPINVPGRRGRRRGGKEKKYAPCTCSDDVESAANSILHHREAAAAAAVVGVLVGDGRVESNELEDYWYSSSQSDYYYSEDFTNDDEEDVSTICDTTIGETTMQGYSVQNRRVLKTLHLLDAVKKRKGQDEDEEVRQKQHWLL